jgi:hypothetical protein
MMERAITSTDATDVESLAERAFAPTGHLGHAPKIAEAVKALHLADRLPRHLRPVERDRRILEWLAEHGYAGDMPSRQAIGRFFAR